jgi:hypothetical protein
VAIKTPTDSNCIAGDCINGKGTYIFPSGNKYEGDWKDYKREGYGKATFFNGDKYEGYFLNNEFNGKGTYYFRNGMKFQGEYVNGMETNGHYYSSNGYAVLMINGKVVEPVAVKNNTGANSKSEQPVNDGKTNCSKCHGRGQFFKMADYGYTNNTSTTTYIDGRGNSRKEYNGSYSTRYTKSEAGFYPCPKCGGTGRVKK